MIFYHLKRFFSKRSNEIKGKLLLALTGALVLNFFFGLLFYICEKDVPGNESLTFFDSVWWSMVTMTTVGYGDLAPKSFAGRFFVAYPCFLFGIGLIGYLLGMFAESMIDFTSRKRKGLLKSRMKNHIIICHCPSENKLINIVCELRATQKYNTIPITVVDDHLETRPASFQKYGVDFVKGDPTDENVLMRAGLKRAEGVVILAQKPGCPDSDSRSFAIGAVIEMVEDELGHAIKTIAEVISNKSSKLFNRSDIDGSVIVEGISDKMMVQEFLHPGIRKTFEQLLTNTTGSQLYSCPTNLVNMRFVDVQAAALQHDHDLQVIGLRRGEEELLNPSKQIVLKENDELIVLAETQYQYNRFEADLLKN